MTVGERLKTAATPRQVMPDPVRPLSTTLTDVLFLHWPVSPATVDPLLPDWLEPDTADESAWISALPLTMAEFDLFGLPVREGVEAVNLRTYVRTADGDRGVYFLSLDVADRLASETARTVFRLPYYHASIRRRRQGDRTEVVARRRTGVEARLTVTFELNGEPTTAAPDTLASFLVERERYFTTGPLGAHLVGSVGHPPWSIQTATATVAENTLLSAADIDRVEGDPLVHYSPGVDMGIGALQPF
jgi:uncharacterized protein YqjF (DUF2071 family)